MAVNSHIIIIMFTKVHNPSENEVALQYLGETYTIGAGKTAEFPEDVAKHWIYIYGFMTTVAADVESIKTEAEQVVEKITKKVAKKK